MNFKLLWHRERSQLDQDIQFTHYALQSFIKDEAEGSNAGADWRPTQLCEAMIVNVMEQCLLCPLQDIFNCELLANPAAEI
jgi:hypothetical protein